MKHTKTPLIITSLLLVISSCISDSASFETVHPINGEALSGIPNSLHGKFVDDDGDLILVDENAVYDLFKIDEVLPVNSEDMKELREDSDVEILEETEDKMVLKIYDTFIEEARIENDSIYLDFDIPNIEFSLKEGDQLIKSGSNFYFNFVNSDGEFRVRRVRKLNSDIVMETLVGKDSIRNLLELSEEVVLSNLKISPKQFELLDRIGFSERERYRKVSE